jgi:hypothetical protein
MDRVWHVTSYLINRYSSNSIVLLDRDLLHYLCHLNYAFKLKLLLHEGRPNITHAYESLAKAVKTSEEAGYLGRNVAWLNLTTTKMYQPQAPAIAETAVDEVDGNFNAMFRAARKSYVCTSDIETPESKVWTQMLKKAQPDIDRHQTILEEMKIDRLEALHEAIKPENKYEIYLKIHTLVVEEHHSKVK